MTEIWDLLSNDKDLFIRTAARERAQDRIPNGSFEDDTNSDGVPDLWVFRSWEGGSCGRSTAYALHGGTSFYASTPGGENRGGGVLETEDFIPAKAGYIYNIRWAVLSTLASTGFTVRVSFYDGTKTFLSGKTVYHSATTPTSWGYQGCSFVSDSGAKYMKFFFDVCPLGSNISTVYLDDVSFFIPRVARNQAVYTTSGTFTVPKDVTGVHVVLIGSGGGGAGGVNIGPQVQSPYFGKPGLLAYRYWDLRYGSGGGGGGEVKVGWVRVRPGDTLTVTVPVGGSGGSFSYPTQNYGHNGSAGSSAWFGDVEAKGGGGGIAPADNTATGYGGSGGASEDTQGLLRISGTDGSAGSKADGVETVTYATEHYYYPTGGDGGVSGYRTMFSSIGGSGGSLNLSILNGFQYEITSGTLNGAIVQASAGSGYGAGGGGGGYSMNGQAGSPGIVVVRY